MDMGHAVFFNTCDMKTPPPDAYFVMSQYGYRDKSLSRLYHKFIPILTESYKKYYNRAIILQMS